MTWFRRGIALSATAIGLLFAAMNTTSLDAPAPPPGDQRPVPKRLTRGATGLAAAPVAKMPVSSKATSRGGPTMPIVPGPLVNSSESAKLAKALREAWPNRPPPKRRRAAQAPASLPRARDGDPTTMQQAFDKMAVDSEWNRLSKGKLIRERQRLQRLGVHVAAVECRVEACRFELVYTGRAADRRRERLQDGPRIAATDKSLVHTWMDKDGGVRTVIFLSRRGDLPLG